MRGALADGSRGADDRRLGGIRRTNRIWASSVPDPGLTTPRFRNGTGDTQIADVDIEPDAAPVPLDFESATDALTADMSPPASPYRRALQSAHLVATSPPPLRRSNRRQTLSPATATIDG